MGCQTRLKREEFSIVFIGTSSGKTCLSRFHSSLLVKSKSCNLLVDCGEGTSRALLTHGVALDSIDGILFSHMHPDHSTGFPSLIVQMKQLKRTKPLKIYCHRNLTESLKFFLHQTFVFLQSASFRIEYLEFEHQEQVVVSDQFIFVSKQNSHLDKYAKHLKDVKAGFASSSFLIMLGEKKVFYSGDLGSSRDLDLFLDQQPEIIITEAAHIDVENILQLVKECDPQKVYLTHLNDDSELEIRQDLAKLPIDLREKIILAFDGFSINI